MYNAKGLIAILAALAIATLSAACAPDAASQSGVTRPDAHSPTVANPAAVADAAPASDTMQTVRIPVEGMSCVACAARVKKTLKAIAGVDEVEVHLGERNARVRFDSRRVAPDRLIAVINELGYRAGTPVSAQR